MLVAILLVTVPAIGQVDTEPANNTQPGANDLGLANMQARLNVANVTPGDLDFFSNMLLTGDTIAAMSTPLGSLPADFGAPDIMYGAFSPGGALVTVNDDAGSDAIGAATVGPDFGSVIRFQAGGTGVHAIGVTGFADFAFAGVHAQAGPYAMTVARFPVAPVVGGNFADSAGNNVPATADSLNLLPNGAVTAVGDLTAGAIGDVDYYSVFMNPGEVLSVFTTPLQSLPANFAGPDTILGVFTPAGVLIETDDDAGNDAIGAAPVGPTRGSAIRYMATAAGLYYIAVSGFPDFAFGGAHTETGLYGLTASLLGVAPDTRVNETQKGSLLVWPEVTIRWNPGGALLRDTIITVGNDLASSGVSIKLFFVNGELPQPLFGPGAGTIEPGWNFFDNVIDLTHDEPTYWSSFTGRAGAIPVVTPFTALDANGRPDGDAANPNAVRLRGFVLGFAVQGNLLRSINHLFGSATLVDYVANEAVDYKAWSFRANFQGTAASPMLFLDGIAAPAHYDACPEYLLLDFFASGSAAIGPNAGGTASTVDTRVTLLPMIHDFCAPLPPEPLMTDAQIDVWNEDEVKLTNQHRCIQCWDSTLLSVYNIHSPLQFWIPGGIVNHFVLGNLGSNKGKARFRGVANTACDRLPNPNASPPTPGLVSVSAPLLGDQVKIVTWGAANAHSGGELHGLGVRQDGRVEYCPQSDPPESNENPVIRSLVGNPVPLSEATTPSKKPAPSSASKAAGATGSKGGELNRAAGRR